MALAKEFGELAKKKGQWQGHGQGQGKGAAVG